MVLERFDSAPGNELLILKTDIMKKTFDLYTPEIVRLTLSKQGFTHVSFRKNSVPDAGSATYNIRDIAFSNKVNVDRTINHRDGSITIVTEHGYLKFIKL